MTVIDGNKKDGPRKFDFKTKNQTRKLGMGTVISYADTQNRTS